MRKYRLAVTMVAIMLLICNVCHSQQLMKVTKVNGATRLVKNGNPILMVGGELNNSSASTASLMEQSFNTLDSMGLNTILAPIAWEQFEPEENVFDYSLIDRMIELAAQHKMHTVVLWFGSWKNGMSGYVPVWVKKDKKRFFRIRNSSGNDTTVISPFCEAACQADAKAFARLVNRIKEKDTQHWIAALQVENEIGCFDDMDHCPAALEAFRKSGLTESRDDKIEFMSRAYACYIEKVTAAGKKVLDLPMYTNAMLIADDATFGRLPNGGPAYYKIDTWKKYAPSLDWLSPDIYHPNYRFYCDAYTRKDNMLFIPETLRRADRFFYAFAEDNAQCVAPFAAEEAYNDPLFLGSIKVLNEILPEISLAQGTGRMHGFMRQGKETGTDITMGDYNLRIAYNAKARDAYGLVIRLSDDEFLFAGVGASVSISNKDAKKTTRFYNIREVERRGDRWDTVCLMNGDQSINDDFVNIRGRIKNVDYGNIPAPPTNYTWWAQDMKRLTLPGIYIAKTYTVIK